MALFTHDILDQLFAVDVEENINWAFNTFHVTFDASLFHLYHTLFSFIVFAKSLAVVVAIALVLMGFILVVFAFIESVAKSSTIDYCAWFILILCVIITLYLVNFALLQILMTFTGYAPSTNVIFDADWHRFTLEAKLHLDETHDEIYGIRKKLTKYQFAYQTIKFESDQIQRHLNARTVFETYFWDTIETYALLIELDAMDRKIFGIVALIHEQQEAFRSVRSEYENISVFIANCYNQSLFTMYRNFTVFYEEHRLECSHRGLMHHTILVLSCLV
eukprot:15532_1